MSLTMMKKLVVHNYLKTLKKDDKIRIIHGHSIVNAKVLENFPEIEYIQLNVTFPGDWQDKRDNRYEDLMLPYDDYYFDLLYSDLQKLES